MPLAPRPPAPTPRAPSDHVSRSKSSVASAEGKAAQRARNKAAGVSTSSGSSGRGLAIAKYPQLDWDEVEDVSDHVCDLAGTISHSQVGSSGNITLTINIPLSYAHAALDAHLSSRDGLAFVRVYKMGFERFQEKMAQEAADAASLIAAQVGFGTQGSIEEYLDGGGTHG